VSKYVVLNLKEAAAHGLLTCYCGHPENNHFSHDDRAKACAHCKCTNYRIKAKVGAGRLIDVDAITERDLAEAIKETA
jgi:hypothetical protein